MGSRSEQEASQRQSSLSDAQAAAAQSREDIGNLTQCLVEVQVDLQLRDQKVSDLEEVMFHNGVTMEYGLQDVQLPAKGQISESAYQERAKGTERALGEFRAQLATYDKKFHDGERQTRRLQEEVKTMQQSQMSDARMETPQKRIRK